MVDLNELRMTASRDYEQRVANRKLGTRLCMRGSEAGVGGGGWAGQDKQTFF